MPLVVYEPESPASVAVNELAKVVAGEADLPYTPGKEQEIGEIVKRLTRALTGRRV